MTSTCRRLGTAQLAFVRCWVEGLDLVAAWNRYCAADGAVDSAGDARRTRGALRLWLDQLRALARAHGRPDIAALFGRDPQAIADTGAAVPTLAACAAVPTLATCATLQATDVDSQAERRLRHRASLGAAGSHSPARRRERLRARQLQALEWLAQVAVRNPRPEDAVAAWLDERIAQRLAAVGIATLAQLQARIAERGFHWQRGIPRLGPEGAARLLRWLDEHSATLGPLPLQALRPRSQLDASALAPRPRSGIVPLERFTAPQALDGAAGSNRAPQARCKLQAANDHAAVMAWLRLRPSSSHTWRAYRKEAERFLLWSVMERGRALSSLDGDDCVAYRDFLAAPPGPWLAPRHRPRWSDAWRPFEGPLSTRSQAVALTIVRALCEWLVRRHYLDSNPWDDVPARADPPALPRLRALSQRQWQHLQDWLQQQAAKAAVADIALARLRFLLNFGYYSGLRLAELAAARTGWLRHEALDDDPDGEHPAWSIMVLGKRAQWREVPLPDAAVAELRRYLASRRLPVCPTELGAETPLVARLGSVAPLTAARIYEVLVAGFRRCADDLEAIDARAAARIRLASTHWLRHTYGSHAAARGVPQDVLQANLGHQSLATTSIYVRAEQGRRHRAVQQAFGPARRVEAD